MEKCIKCGYNHDEKETCEQVTERVKLLRKGIEIAKSGYGGINKIGHIVDRREFPDAVPILENAMFGNPKPKDI